MSDKNSAIILAVEAAGLPASFGMTQLDGLHVRPNEETLQILASAGTWLGPRGRLEEDPRFRQIIPYVIVRQGDKIVTYIRGASGGEDRLHGKLSIGLGGHIDLADVRHFNSRIDLATTLYDAANRELDEEVNLDSFFRGDVKWIGLLTSNAADVDKVHIGVVGILDIEPISDKSVVLTAEDSQEGIALMTPAELQAESSRLENWTRLCLPYLAADNGAR